MNQIPQLPATSPNVTQPISSIDPMTRNKSLALEVLLRIQQNLASQVEKTTIITRTEEL